MEARFETGEKVNEAVSQETMRSELASGLLLEHPS
jgi:hypothetical protein